MTFEWDPQKNEQNFLKHGIEFVDILALFDQALVTLPDTRQDYGEERFISYGVLYGLVLCVVYTKRRQTIRLISARRANRRESRKYHEKWQTLNRQDQLGSAPLAE